MRACATASSGLYNGFDWLLNQLKSDDDAISLFASNNMFSKTSETSTFDESPTSQSKRLLNLEKKMTNLETDFRGFKDEISGFKDEILDKFVEFDSKLDNMNFEKNVSMNFLGKKHPIL